MDLMKALDIALGMMAIYLVFALAVTALNEAVAGVLDSRAKWLRRGIRSLLTAPAASAADTEVKVRALYDSPFISHLGGMKSWGNAAFPISYLPPWSLLQAALDAVQTHKGQALASLEAIGEAAKALPERSPLRVSVLDMLERSEGQLANFKTLVDEWATRFDEQISAWYRQKTQAVLLLLSVLLSAALNLDSLSFLRQLSSDSKVRAAWAEKALEFSKQTSPDQILDRGPVTQAREAVAEAKKQKNDEALKKAEAELAEARVAQEQAARDLLAAAEATGLQFGWTREQAAALRGVEWAWVEKVLGLLITALALSLGAPFWFDMLKKVAAVRAVGLNPAERQKKKAEAGTG